MQYRAILLVLLCVNLCRAQDRNQSQPFSSSRQKEAVLGAALAAQVRRQTTPLGLAGVDGYVGNLGRQLASQIAKGPKDWEFNVIRDHQTGSTSEPLSLPGGWVFVPAQLILAVDDEAEFAGMLAHAMAHVAERQAVRQPAAQLASIPLAFMRGPAEFGADDENRSVPAQCLNMVRQYELEADRAAVGIVAAAGFDPDALLKYIARVQPEHMEGSEKFSRLPPRSVRINNLEQAVQNTSTPGLRQSNTSFRAVQDEVRRESNSASSVPTKAQSLPSLVHPTKR